MNERSLSAAPAWPRQRSNLGLVDELRMFRNPHVVGGGQLFETRTCGSRVIYERYRRVRDDSD